MLNGFLFLLAFGVSGCAILHHVQIGELDNRKDFVKVPFDIKVSEVGVDLKQAGKAVDLIGKNKNKQGEKAGNFIEMFQMGPRTGMPVYSTKWAETVIYKIYEACPSGQVTGLMSIREHRDYSVVSGEIVKITGYCLKRKI
jgi:hypothetical protein